MSKRTANNLFILSSMPRFYQHLFTGVASYEALGNRIIRRIRNAHAFRDLQQVCQLAEILQNFPIKEYQLIGGYYIVWCKCRQREYDIEALERIIDQSDTYKAKALLSRAAFEGYKGDTTAELSFYNEALRAFPAISERIDILRAIAVVKSKEGFHKSAIRDLESLIPIIRHADALVYFDYLNSLAVELGEAGRMTEARNISRIVINSPFAFAYPEWQGTANDLRGESRSFVAFNPSQYIKSDVLLMPEREHEERPQQESEPARVLSLQQWKTKMSNDKDNGEQIKPLEEMSGREMLVRVLDLFSNPSLTDEQIYRMLKAAEEAAREPNKPKSDK
jgi:tetratricopeptide (TPR) repeat protein